MNRRRFFLLFLVFVVVGLGIAYWRLTSRPPAVESPPPAPPAAAGDPHAEARRKLLGVWHDGYRGKRTMTLNDDGTGTMHVELSGLDAMFGAKLRFDMTWSFDGQSLKKTTVGGEPKESVNLILNMMGNTADEKVLELTDDRLLLLDQDGKRQYDWRRVRS